MRFVPAGCLVEGMIIGKDLFGKDGVLLLREGQPLTKLNITRVGLLGYQGIYIIDDISRNIEIQSVIDDELRQKTINAIKNMFIHSNSNLRSSSTDSKNIEHAKRIAIDIVEEIINNKTLMVNMIDLKVFHDYTYSHSVNVAVLSIVMGVALSIDRQQLYKLCLGALFHDIGKMFIPKDIIDKNGKLCDEEFDYIKKHSELGYNYLKEKWDIPIKSYLAVLYHHERYNGSGYPYGRIKDAITLFGRIVAIADVYDALTSERPYRKAMFPSDAVEYIMGGSGTHFDPEIVKVFVRKVAPFPIGTCVLLSNGVKGIVIENYEDFCTRPKVRIMDKNSDEERYMDLAYDEDVMNVTIKEILEM